MPDSCSEQRENIRELQIFRGLEHIGRVHSDLYDKASVFTPESRILNRLALRGIWRNILHKLQKLILQKRLEKTDLLSGFKRIAPILRMRSRNNDTVCVKMWISPASIGGYFFSSSTLFVASALYDICRRPRVIQASGLIFFLDPLKLPGVFIQNLLNLAEYLESVLPVGSPCAGQLDNRRKTENNYYHNQSNSSHVFYSDIPYGRHSILPF